MDYHSEQLTSETYEGTFSTYKCGLLFVYFIVTYHLQLTVALLIHRKIGKTVRQKILWRVFKALYRPFSGGITRKQEKN